MAVLITRLLTGEEILGESTTNSTDGTIKIENPTQIAAARNPANGNVDVHMAPFAALSSSKHIEIRAQHVLCQYEPVVEVVNKYNKMFGSGIIIPTNSGVQTII
jgi:hypothetical protein